MCKYGRMFNKCSHPEGCAFKNVMLSRASMG